MCAVSGKLKKRLFIIASTAIDSPNKMSYNYGEEGVATVPQSPIF